MLACFGILDEVTSDNEPQFSCAEFREFCIQGKSEKEKEED